MPLAASGCGAERSRAVVVVPSVRTRGIRVKYFIVDYGLLGGVGREE
jgi:hypothetical protein